MEDWDEKKKQNFFFLNFELNINFSLPTFKIINFQSLAIYEI